MNSGYKKRIVNNARAMDYICLEENILAICRRYRQIEHSVIGKSYLGKNINLLRIGGGRKKTLIVGAHHGMEWLTSMITLRFCEDYCAAIEANMDFFGYNAPLLAQTRTIYAVPMLNPDGVDLALNGASASGAIYQRLLEINSGSTDFSRWQANARGVDLNHNYDAGFELLREIEKSQGINSPAPTRYGGEAPLSEPETAALAAFIKKSAVGLLIALHTQGEEIFWRYGDSTPPESYAAAKLFASVSGYKISDPAEDIAAHAGCKDWFIAQFKRPALTIECGKGKNPLPLAAFFPAYTKSAPAIAAVAADFS